MSFAAQLESELAQFKRDGVYKRLNYLDSPQAARVKMEGRGEVVILSSNNYLGLCAVPDVVQAGKDALDRWGAGTGSVRFICGTFTVHRELEAALAKFVGCESSLSYVSCWNANEGLCPTLLGEQDIVISDQLNHASIIDAIRLAKTITKCQTAVYQHADMADLEEKLKAAKGSRLKLIFTDGIFSMEGDIAKLPDIVALARKYDAVVAIDARQGAGRRRRRVHRRPRRARRLSDAAVASPALQQCAPAHRRGKRARRGAPPRTSPRARGETARERALFPRSAHRDRIQTPARGDAHRARHPRRDRQGDPDE